MPDGGPRQAATPPPDVLTELEDSLGVCWAFDLSRPERVTLLRAAGLASELSRCQWHELPPVARAELIRATADVLRIALRLSREVR